MYNKTYKIPKSTKHSQHEILIKRKHQPFTHSSLFIPYFIPVQFTIQTQTNNENNKKYYSVNIQNRKVKQSSATFNFQALTQQPLKYSEDYKQLQQTLQLNTQNNIKKGNVLLRKQILVKQAQPLANKNKKTMRKYINNLQNKSKQSDGLQMNIEIERNSIKLKDVQKNVKKKVQMTDMLRQNYEQFYVPQQFGEFKQVEDILLEDVIDSLKNKNKHYQYGHSYNKYVHNFDYGEDLMGSEEQY